MGLKTIQPKANLIDQAIDDLWQTLNCLIPGKMQIQIGQIFVTL